MRNITILLLAVSPVFANTSLNFDACTTNPPTSACYATADTSVFGFFSAINNGTSTFGDNVGQNLDPNGQGYYGGSADTPHITVQFDSVSLSGWAHWGGAEDGISFASDTGAGYITLIAAAGYQVTLSSFDYNVAGSEGFSLQVLDGGPSSTNIVDDYSGSTTGNSALSFSPNATSNEITIYFNNWNTAVNNIDFSESPLSAATPEPASFGFISMGMLSLGFLRRCSISRKR